VLCFARSWISIDRSFPYDFLEGRGSDLKTAAGCPRMNNRIGGDSPASDLLESGFVDVTSPTLPIGATVLDAVELMLKTHRWGVPIVEHERDYVGMITAASVLARSLPIHPETILPHSSLGWLPDVVKTMRGRLRSELTHPVEALIDISVPPVRISTSPADVLLLLMRRAPMLPVVSDSDRRFIGIVSWHPAIEALHRHGL
jgi:CBS domain-containing protein